LNIRFIRRGTLRKSSERSHSSGFTQFYAAFTLLNIEPATKVGDVVRNPSMDMELNGGKSRKSLLPCRGLEHPLRARLLCLNSGPVDSVSWASTFADDSATATTSLYQAGSSIADTGTGYSLFRGPQHGSNDYWIECSCSNGALAVRSCPSLSYKCYCADKPSTPCNQ
jgi:hypothetical protein